MVVTAVVVMFGVVYIFMFYFMAWADELEMEVVMRTLEVFDVCYYVN